MALRQLVRRVRTHATGNAPLLRDAASPTMSRMYVNDLTFKNVYPASTRIAPTQYGQSKSLLLFPSQLYPVR